ncbi:MAG: beta-ketoacyl-ACP reductase [Terriglobales bacterium]
MTLTGRVAVVTGASQGIGRACALKLAKCGASVALIARNREKLEEVAREIQQVAASNPDHEGTSLPASVNEADRGATGVPARATDAEGAGTTFPPARAYVLSADMQNDDDIKSAFKSILGEFGKIDILVNNAGITRDQLLMRMKRVDWDSVLNTNLTSAYLCTQQVIGSMLKQRWGRIINITSIFGQMGQAGQANYAASKAGLIGLTMAVARELGSRSITCNAVAPGFIETAMTAELPEELKQNALKMIPLGRIGSTEDVANCVAFLASEEAGYITGHVLNVNGGMLMG